MRHLSLLLLGIHIKVPPAWACSCVETDPVEAAEASGVAYVGEIVSIDEPNHGFVGLFGCGGEENEYGRSHDGPVDVRVLTPLHGDLVEGDEVTLTFHLGSAGGDCSLNPDVGDRWIFYTADEEDPISLCAPDGPWSRETEDELRAAFGR